MLHVGDKFSSFDEFHAALKEYESAALNNFWIRDCRTLTTHRRKFPNGTAAHARDELKYYFAAISCIQGGKRYSSKSKKRQTMTMRQGCRAGMLLKLSKCCNYLELVKLNEDHNHVLSNKWESCPDENDATQTRKGVKSRKIEDLKYLTTLPNGSKKADVAVEFAECVNGLQTIHDCEVNILCDEEDNVLSIFFQDPEMKTVFNAYPEVIFIEGTYCLYKGGPSTYLILVEDPEGNGAVVAVGMFLHEDEEVIDWMVNQFVECNPSANDIEVVMSDKGCKVGASFNKVFPNTFPHIPIFHTMRILSADLNPNKMDLTREHSEHAVKLFRNLVFAISEHEFNEEYNKMRDSVSEPVMSYYENNWAAIQDQWVMYRTINFKYFLNQTNNKVENVCQKFKSIISRFTILKDFLKNFFCAVDSIRASINCGYNIKYHMKTSDDIEAAYKELLTNYAFEKVQQQIRCMNDCNEFQIIDEERSLTDTPEGLLEVTATTCPCLFRYSMGLPCRHIFKFRSDSTMPLFEESLCSERWSKNYYLLHQPNKYKDNTEAAVLSKDEKLKIINDTCYKLSKLSSKVPADLFEKRLRYVKFLIERWSCMDGEEEGSYEDVDNEFKIVNGDADDQNYVLIKRVKREDVTSEDDIKIENV